MDFTLDNPVSYTLSDENLQQQQQQQNHQYTDYFKDMTQEPLFYPSPQQLQELEAQQQASNSATNDSNGSGISNNNNNNDNSNNNNDNSSALMNNDKKFSPIDTSTLTEEELYQRRKAQNRAAQRAFRERKEGKLKELSIKLERAELERLKLEKQLNDIKQKNLLLDMENQLLQTKGTAATTCSPNSSVLSQDTLSANVGVDKNFIPGVIPNLSFKFPNTTKSDFINGTVDLSKHKLTIQSFQNKISQSYKYEDEKVLTVGAVWDYLVEFSNLNEDLDIEIPGIMDSLRGQEVCHGFGPAYPISLVNEIIMKHVKTEE